MLRLRKRRGLLDTGDHKCEFILEAGIPLGHVAMLATTRICPIVAEGAEHPFHIRALYAENRESTHQFAHPNQRVRAISDNSPTV
jgi:hypothetical protein